MPTQFPGFLKPTIRILGPSAVWILVVAGHLTLSVGKSPFVGGHGLWDLV
jgi:hypothetical protein